MFLRFDFRIHDADNPIGSDAISGIFMDLDEAVADPPGSVVFRVRDGVTEVVELSPDGSMHLVAFAEHDPYNRYGDRSLEALEKAKALACRTDDVNEDLIDEILPDAWHRELLAVYRRSG